MSTTRRLQGTGVSPGIARAPAVRVRGAVGIDPDEAACTDPQSDGERVRGALAAVARVYEQRAESVEGEAREILRMTAQLAADRSLAKAVDARLAAGSGATRALSEAIAGYVERLQAIGGYMGQRASDLHDVRDRAIAQLRGLPAPGLPVLSAPAIVVAHDLAPAETAVLDPALVRGIVTSGGGPTSHTALLAASLGIPAAVQVAGADEIDEGADLVLDGTSGEVLADPREEEAAQLLQRGQRRAAATAEMHGPGRTADGHAVALLANIGSVADAEALAEADVEGVGLLRTEFLFLDRAEAPSEDEQAEAYTRMLTALGERRLVVRTFDAGSDKPLAFADLGAEENPALGRRGLRLARERTDLLDAQLRALARAQDAVGGDLRVMAPMVATAEEAGWFAQRARAAGLRTVGIMVETPAAALCAADVLHGLDFASIGTNDLTQYAMAADRLQGELGELLDPWQPAVLRLVGMTCTGGEEAGAAVGVCGQAAADPLLALVLVGLGVSSLSMPLGRVPAVRAALRAHSLEQCRAVAERALAAGSAYEAREAARELADPAIAELV